LNKDVPVVTIGGLAMPGIKKSDVKMSVREQARQKIRPTMGNVGADRTYRERVETGRQHFLTASAEGGDPRGKKIKGELIYLLNNYLPSYDNQIEQLIDAWRRSGDPAYDASIRVKLRQARIKYQSQSKAI